MDDCLDAAPWIIRASMATANKLHGNLSLQQSEIILN